MIILAAVFLFCGGTVAVVQHQYAVNKRLYRAASDAYTAPASVTTLSAHAGEDGTQEEKPSKLNDGVYRLPENAPIQVDFAALQEENSDVIIVKFVKMHGLSNDTYLHHSYDGTYNASGSIFVDERNQRNFADPISILYGHHMASGAMFATIGWWQSRSYFDEHPYMWLLTPEQDYKGELYSAYNTSAYSDTYEIPPYSGGYFPDYLGRVESYAAFHTGIDLDPDAHYIVMSTCAYMFEDARSVLHGKLVPVMSAGGVPME